MTSCNPMRRSQDPRNGKSREPFRKRSVFTSESMTKVTTSPTRDLAFPSRCDGDLCVKIEVTTPQKLVPR